ncbi:hypothetical protein WDW89_13720 [Deltaproteobacteria bacterium TL4]
MEYVEDQFQEACLNYAEKPVFPAVAELLVELDGCEIRTGKLVDIEGTQETKPIRGLAKQTREVSWKDVRTGFVRGMEDVDKIYVGGLEKYEVLGNQLFGAAVMKGLTETSSVVALCDGGNGIDQELARQFADRENYLFILDKTHLKDHLYETAEELGLKPGEERSPWVNSILERVSAGNYQEVRKELQELYAQNGNDRLRRLLGYMERFKDSIDYEHFKEQGYPIGSGEVESSHKLIAQKRLKIPGACWLLENVNPLYAIRLVKANGWWSDFWKQRGEKSKSVVN